MLTEPIKVWVGGFVETGVLESSQRTPSVLGYVRMAVAKEKASARQNSSRGHSSWVQHWVQLGPVLGSLFGVKRCRINELVLSQQPNALPLSYRGTAQRICFHSNTECEIKLLRVWVQHGANIVIFSNCSMKCSRVLADSQRLIL